MSYDSDRAQDCAFILQVRMNVLQGSLKKWNRILQRITDKSMRVREGGTGDCPCCIEFYDNDCKGCPIKDYTGKRQCLDTPYVEWMKLREAKEHHYPYSEDATFTIQEPAEVVMFKRIAAKEVKFLEKVYNKERREADKVIKILQKY